MPERRETAHTPRDAVTQPSDGPSAAPRDMAPALDSDTLLRGHSSVEITHRGAVYRLQATRQGKLILTK
jgi:hemin uptake protein HemP